MAPITRNRVSANNVARETNDLTPKAMFEQRLAQLPPDAQQKLLSGQWQLVPFIYYGVKRIDGKSNIKIFESGDTTSKGLTNIVQGRMPAEDYFLCTDVRLLFQKSDTGNTENDLFAAPYEDAPVANVINGEWMLGQESTTYIEKSAASVFDNHTQTNVQNGIYKLPTPKMFYPQRTIKAEFDIVGSIVTPGSGAGAAWMRFEMHGVKTAKA